MAEAVDRRAKMRRSLTDRESRGLEAELKRWLAFLNEEMAGLDEFLAELLGEPHDHNDRAS